MSGTFTVKLLHHYNIRAPAALVERVRAFYVDVIGLRNGPVPPMATRAYWLYIGDQPVIHLNTLPDDQTASLDTKPTGWIDHIAFTCSDHSAARARLDAAGVPYSFNAFPAANAVQIFLHDPTGIKLELNFFGEGVTPGS